MTFWSVFVNPVTYDDIAKKSREQGFIIKKYIATHTFKFKL